MNLYEYLRFGFEDGTLLIYKEDWQSLKSQYIEEKR